MLYLPRPGSSKYHIGTVRKNYSPKKLKLIRIHERLTLKAVAIIMQGHMEGEKVNHLHYLMQNSLSSSLEYKSHFALSRVQRVVKKKSSKPRPIIFIC